MAKKAIPKNVRREVEHIVRQFNRTELDEGIEYQTRYKGKYVYVARKDRSYTSEVFRLTYTGEMDNWDFAIFRHTTDRYHPDEWFFPGEELVDGTIEGALRAGMKAYPPMKPLFPSVRKFFGFFGNLFTKSS